MQQPRGPGESTPEVAIASGAFSQPRHGGDSSRLLAAAQRVPGDQVRVRPPGLGWGRRRGVSGLAAGLGSGLAPSEGQPPRRGAVARATLGLSGARHCPRPRSTPTCAVSDGGPTALLLPLRSFILSFSQRAFSLQTRDVGSEGQVDETQPCL